ncbi:GntR family transcriptional regulator [Streptomyces sulphureus]|uniref:GntR family transcriptional regulator n=1 Tax=Streptomyces sulphureus TaxID=47758 RepID=UPI000367BFB1|nr:GntR family transcriptional regulator [Streptomyces sulphureus]
MAAHGALSPYRRIAQQIIDRIESGDLQPGDKVPSVRDIVRETGVSSGTASKVPGVLRELGYADAAPGVGTVVRPRKSVTAGADRLALVRAARPSVGEDERVEILDLRREEASQEVADALGVELGVEVARRRRMYCDAAGVVTVSATWVTGAVADAAPEFLESAPLPKLTFGLIEERTGRAVAGRRDTYELRRVPTDVAAHLGVDEGAVALAVVNHYWDADGEPTEYAVDFLGPGRSLVIEHDVT